LIPVVWWIVVGAIGLCGAGAKILWEDIVIAVKGKRIAILGAKATGKTTLADFLSKGEIPQEYFQTIGVDRKDKRPFELKDLNLKIYLKSFNDVEAGLGARTIWQEEVKKADVVLYLFDTNKLLRYDEDAVRKGYAKRIKSDLEQVCSWLHEKTGPQSLYILGTFCDQDPNYDPSRLSTYRDELVERDELKEMKRILKGKIEVTWIFGSTKDLKSTEAIVKLWLKILLRK